MLITQSTGFKKIKFIERSYFRLFLLVCFTFLCHVHLPSLHGEESADLLCEDSYEITTPDAFGDIREGIISRDKEFRAQKGKDQGLFYYLYISDFAKSFIEIPTSNVSVDSSTISSKYLAGRAELYNEANKPVGTCSASFLCMENEDGFYTDISNYFSVDNGLIVSWFTPTRLGNLELDSIIHSMVTKCIVVASTKIGFNPYYGTTFDLVVSSDYEKIYFKFTRR